jgi:hypothetical protein
METLSCGHLPLRSRVSTRIASPKVAATFLFDPSLVSGPTRFESDAGFARLSAPLLLEQVYHSL